MRSTCVSEEIRKIDGAPDAIIADPSGEQLSGPLRQFCNEISTTVRTLEHGTRCDNRATLYIGLMKEATLNDILNI